jgi:ribosomal peptide maturation radical SAM protein 1
MPFLSLERPALGIALLKASLRDAGIDCDCKYLQFSFADTIGTAAYRSITDDTPTHDLVGEWVFTRALYQENAQPDSAFLGGIFQGGVRRYDEALLSSIERCRSLAPQFIESCADDIVDQYDIVGFSTSFQQNVASLALARALKARSADLLVMFGGANCEGEMGVEIHRRFPFVDVVVHGEADHIAAALVRGLREGRVPDTLSGVTYRFRGESLTVPGDRPPVDDMDALPIPDHDDFIRDFKSSGAAAELSPQLVMETSRGCWWGQKHHCTFCGLNGQQMSYRSKSPGRALGEIIELIERYGIFSIFNTDNIVDMRYFSELLPKLQARGLRLQLFYETKSNLKKHQIRALHELGTRWFQPGIESLNTHVLKLMNKGVTGIQNVLLLKWAREFDFDITWNLLCGFPGERPEDYEETARLIPLITHLQPPSAVSRFRLDRFSPMFERPHEYGITDAAPYPAYRLCYPFADESLRRLAYFFDCRSTTTPETLAAIHQTFSAVGAWQSHCRSASLEAAVEGDSLVITDQRPGYGPARHVLSGLERDLYQMTEEPHSKKQMLAGLGLGEAELTRHLDRLSERGLVMRENDSYLGLAVLRGASAVELPARQTPDVHVLAFAPKRTLPAAAPPERPPRSGRAGRLLGS